MFAPILWPHIWLHWPTFTYQGLVWCFHRSWHHAILACIALTFDGVMFGIADSAVSIWETSYLNTFLKGFGDFRVSRFPLDDLLVSHEDKLFRFVYHPENFPLLNSLLPPITDTFRAFLLIPGSRKSRPPHLTTFQSLDGSCIMFFNDPRHKLTKIQEFSLLHELGHGGKDNALTLTAKTGRLRFFSFFAWVVLFSLRGGHGLVVLAGCLLQCAIRLFWKESPWELSQTILKQEIAADRFAASIASRPLLEAVLRQRLKIPNNDSRLRPTQNEFRNRHLIELLKKTIAGEPAKPPVQTGFGWRFCFINLGSLAVLAWIDQTVTVFGIVAAIIVVILLAIFYFGSINPEVGRDRRAIIEFLENRIVEQ
jgi:hypothetical protein